MNGRKVIWLPSVKSKLIQFRSKYFTPEETLNIISEVILETEDILKNPILSSTYTEEIGKYKGISRIVIRRFRVYFERIDDKIIIIAILFPGEQ